MCPTIERMSSAGFLRMTSAEHTAGGGDMPGMLKRSDLIAQEVPIAANVAAARANPNKARGHIEFMLAAVRERRAAEGYRKLRKVEIRAVRRGAMDRWRNMSTEERSTWKQQAFEKASANFVGSEAPAGVDKYTASSSHGDLLWGIGCRHSPLSPDLATEIIKEATSVDQVRRAGAANPRAVAWVGSEFLFGILTSTPYNVVSCREVC